MAARCEVSTLPYAYHPGAVEIGRMLTQMVQNSFGPTLRFAPTSVWKPSEWVSSEGNKTLPKESEKKKKQSRKDCMYVLFKIGVYFKITNIEIKRTLNA